MLELKNITKDYLAGENTVHALKGIDLKFRSCEFVSILGPSGCGKTTMLNIIGGLDRYTKGDLIINGRSTTHFKNRDWDAYRNYSVGFVFQSYNLIPHQTVLQNVEIALTLSGVSRSERRERAVRALEQVGLGDQLRKKPSEMSGGQMQRVAIARAIVNDPDIILADEPTGALDTKTSIQVMNILKEIAKDRLVVMVTHNPEIANEYSTRIVHMLDGVIHEDTRPLTDEEIKAEEERDRALRDETVKAKKKPSMSLMTSFGLSLKNLITKKGRTILTSFAGSIGIIGIALIYSVSQGFQNYIDNIQEETLSSYPLTIQQTNTDLSAIMETFMNIKNKEIEHDNDGIYKRSSVYEIVNAFNDKEGNENDLRSFREYIEEQRKDENSKLSKALNGVQYSYDHDMLVYTKNVDGDIILSDAKQLMTQLIAESMNIDLSSMTSMSSSSMMGGGLMSGGMNTGLWQEMLSGKDGKPISPLIEKQYDVIYGSWPNNYDEIVLVLDKNNELNDMALYALGLESKEQIDRIMDAAMNGKTVDDMGKTKWNYEDICNAEYRVVLNSDCYSYDEETGLYSDLRSSDTGLMYLYDNAIPLKVTGIIKPSEKAAASMLTGSIAYTKGLTEYIVDKIHDSPVIKAQLDNPDKDVITGLPFRSASGSVTDEEKEKEFRSYIGSLNDSEKAAMFMKLISIPPAGELEEQINAALSSVDRSEMQNVLVKMMTQQMGMSEEDIQAYITKMSDSEIKKAYETAVMEQIKGQYAAQAAETLKTLSPEQINAGMEQMMKTMSAADCAYYYDEVMEFSKSTLEDNLREMGYIELEQPSAVNLYASSFENKDIIEEVISDYNSGKDEMKQIKYTDYIKLMMSSITTIINAITYVLIAFVSVSLIVSSIMIGVITLISVQERTKEIGILRAIGASKRNISNMFNAETALIGLSAGLLGVAVSWLLILPINAVIEHLTEITTLKATLPVTVALVLVAISVVLTIISGIIPSKSAAKKDPVVALRTE